MHPCSLSLVDKYERYPNSVIRPFYSGSCRGFTLVEVLVMVAVIGLLSALLMPLMAQARERSRQANCIGQLHQTWMAYDLASQDFGVPKEEVPYLGDAPFAMLKVYEKSEAHHPAQFLFFQQNRSDLYAQFLGIRPDQVEKTPELTADTPFLVDAQHHRFGVYLVCTYEGSVYRDRSPCWPAPFPPPDNHWPCAH